MVFCIRRSCMFWIARIRSISSSFIVGFDAGTCGVIACFQSLATFVMSKPLAAVTTSCWDSELRRFDGIDFKEPWARRGGGVGEGGGGSGGGGGGGGGAGGGAGRWVVIRVVGERVGAWVGGARRSGGEEIVGAIETLWLLELYPGTIVVCTGSGPPLSLHSLARRTPLDCRKTHRVLRWTHCGWTTLPLKWKKYSTIWSPSIRTSLILTATNWSSAANLLKRSFYRIK